MRKIALSLLAGVAFAGAALAQPASPPSSGPLPPNSSAQEQIERTIGQLYVLNAQQQAQIMQQAGQLAELRRQLEQAKQGAEPKVGPNPDANGTPAKPQPVGPK